MTKKDKELFDEQVKLMRKLDDIHICLIVEKILSWMIDIPEPTPERNIVMKKKLLSVVEALTQFPLNTPKKDFIQVLNKILVAHELPPFRKDMPPLKSVNIEKN